MYVYILRLHIETNRPTLQVKNISEDLVKELEKLKVKLSCKRILRSEVEAKQICESVQEKLTSAQGHPIEKN